MTSVILIKDVDNEREKWAEERKTRVGSSEIAAIMGLSKYKSALDVYLEKQGLVDPQPDTIRLKMGRVKEPLIAELFAERTSFEVVRAGHAITLKNAPWCLATPDYYGVKNDGTRVILELKNIGSYSASEWADENIPDYYYSQIIWQMGVTGIEEGYLVALIGDSSLEIRHVKFSRSTFEIMKDTARVFCEMVKTSTPPSATDLDLEGIQSRYKPTRTEKELDEPSLYFIKQYNEAKAEVDALKEKMKAPEKEMKTARANLILTLGDYQIGTLGRYTVEAKKILVKAEEKPRAEYYKTTFNIKEEEIEA